MKFSELQNEELEKLKDFTIPLQLQLQLFGRKIPLSDGRIIEYDFCGFLVSKEIAGKKFELYFTNYEIKFFLEIKETFDKFNNDL